MKKICIAFLFITCLFAILFELSGSDPDNAFSFRSYFQYVTENIVPFPTVDFSGNLLADIWQVVSYLFCIIDCVIRNVIVLLQGFFPVSWSDPSFSVPVTPEIGDGQYTPPPHFELRPGMTPWESFWAWFFGY